MPGVALVGGGPGDPELITVRGRRLLARADVVVVDRLAPRELLDELPPHVEVVDAAKIPYGRAASQDVINATLIEQAKAGKFVVRLKGGDSYVFGRGYEELLACAAAGVPVTVVPGVTSAFAVPAVAGVPVTHRGVAHEVVVVSGHVAPDDERSLVDWNALARLQRHDRAADGPATDRGVRQGADRRRASVGHAGAGHRRRHDAHPAGRSLYFGRCGGRCCGARYPAARDRGDRAGRRGRGLGTVSLSLRGSGVQVREMSRAGA